MLSFFNSRQRTRLQDEENGAALEKAALSTHSTQNGLHTIHPCLAEQCSTHAVERNDARILEWCKESEERVKVNVGHGRGRCSFMIHKQLLRHYSEYFRAALRSDAFREAVDGEFDFPDADPQAFKRFVRWLYSCRACKKGDGDHRQHQCPPGAAADPSSWCGLQQPERDYVLADWLLSRRYCAFVLAHFVAHVGDDFGLDRVRWVLENTTEDSPMQRFARHWVCWLKLRWLDGSSPLDWARHPDLDALDAGWAATDPRKLALDHWEEGCCAVASPPSPTARRSSDHNDAPAPPPPRCAHRLGKPAPAEPAAVSASDDLPAKVARGLGRIPRRRLWDKYREPLTAAFGLLVLIYHFLFPFAWVGIAAFIVVTDVDPLLFEASKLYSLVVGCFAVLGIWPICMRMMNMYLSVACSLLVLMASVLSFASSSTCLAGADREEEVSICRMEIGIGVLQFFYSIIVGTSYKW